jgi:hypothetical protein
VDDFFENGPDDLGPASGVTTVEFHNASLDSGGYRGGGLGDRHRSLVSIGNDAVQQIGQAQGK